MIDVPWRRLDPRMLVVGPLKNLMQLLPFLLVVLLTGRSGDLNQIWFAVGGAAVVVLAGVCAGGPPATGSRTSASSCTPAGCAGSGARYPGIGSAPSTSRRLRSTGCSA